MLDSLLKEWDGENLILRYDQPTGAFMCVAIHSTRNARNASGGTRMRCYPELSAAVRDAFRLSEAMTYKWALAGMDLGGAKCVISLPPNLDPEARKGLLKRYGALIRDLRGLYATGPDVGASTADMDAIAEGAGVYGSYVTGTSEAGGGSGSSGPATALGVFTGIQVACQHVFGQGSTKGRRVLVQGAGSVGEALIEYLREDGAEVMFSEIDEGTVRRFRDEFGLEFVAPNQVHSVPCDVYAPCALGEVLSAETIPHLSCKIVAGGANTQLATAQDAERLRAKGIFYAPDYVVNVGGALFLSAHARGLSTEGAMEEVVRLVRKNLSRIFDLAATEGITTDAAAKIIGKECLAARKLSAVPAEVSAAVASEVADVWWQAPHHLRSAIQSLATDLAQKGT